MFDESKTEAQLKKELQETNNRIAELEQTEQSLSLIFKASLDLDCFVDINKTTFLKINPAFQAILGFSEIELLGRSFLDIIHPDDLNPSIAVIKELSESSKSALRFENRCRTAGGDYRNLEWTFHVIPGKGIAYAAARDITGRKRTELALIESEEWHRTLIETLPDPVIVYDLQGNILSVSGKAPKLLGAASAEELIADIKNIGDLLSKEDRQKAFANFARTLEHGHSENTHYNICLKNGGAVPIEVHSSLLRHSDGTPRGFISVVHDITERTRAENALRESETMFRGVADNMIDVLFVTNDQGYIDYISPSAKKIFGWDASQFIGHRFIEYIPESEIHAALNQFGHMIASGERVTDFSSQMIRKDGTIFPGEVTASVLKKGDRLIGILGMIRDVTDRRQREEDMQRQLRFEKGLSAASACLVTTSDPQRSVTAALNCLCDAAQAARVHIFENFEDPIEGLCIRQIYESCADGVSSEFNNPSLRNFPFRKGFLRWRDLLSVGQHIQGHVADFPPEERTVLELQGIISILVLPLSVRGQWYGFIGFDETRAQRLWRDEDISLLRTAADLIGSFLARNQTEKSLGESESRFKGLIEQSPVSTQIMDKTGKTIQVNKAWEQLWGLTLKDLGDYNMLEDRQLGESGVLSYIQRAFAGEAVVIPPTEYSAEKTLGKGLKRWVRSRAYPVRDDSGNIREVTLMHEDVTDLRRAEEALKESEKRFRLLVQNSNDIIQILNEQAVTSYVSDQSMRILGYRPEELVGISPFPDIHPEDLPNVQSTLKKSLERPGEVLKAECRYRHKNGNWVHVETIGCNLLNDPSIQGIVLNIRDVTERAKAEQEQRKLQEQLQQAMKMEAVGRLAGGVAHDFNNLLTGISGNVQLALFDLKSTDPLADTLREIGRAAESAAALTHQLLAFSRKQLIEPKVIDLNDLISSMIKMMGRLIGEDIELRTKLGKNLEMVKIDPGQFEQILVNLAINARDAMPNGGILIIETANVELDSEYCHTHTYTNPGRYVMLAVSDTGLGMSAEIKSHVFEPFFTTKEKGKGTGLGLATIYGTVKQALGSIEVYSEEGNGTTFKIYLPLVEEKPEKFDKNIRLMEIQGGKETILLVEDEEIVRNLAIRILKRLGYKALCASSGGDALIMAEQYSGQIHLLFTDIIMPGINGRQLAERISILHPEIRVLFSSGYTEDVIAHHGIIDKDLHFIGKPYTPATLAKAIRNTLDGLPVHKRAFKE